MSNLKKMEVLMKMNKSLLFAALLAAFSQTMPMGRDQNGKVFSFNENRMGRDQNGKVFSFNGNRKPGQPVPEISGPDRFLEKTSDSRSPIILNELEPSMMISKAPTSSRNQDLSKDQLAREQFNSRRFRNTLRQGNREIANAAAAVAQVDAVVADENFLGKTTDNQAGDFGFRRYGGDETMLGGNGKEASQSTLTPAPAGYHYEDKGPGFRHVLVRDTQPIVVGGKGSYAPIAKPVLIGGKGSWSPVKWSSSSDVSTTSA
jgi:hypothetical protein